MTEEPTASPETPGAAAQTSADAKRRANWWEPLASVGFAIGLFTVGFLGAQPVGLTIGWAGFFLALSGIIALPQAVFAAWREASVELNEAHYRIWSMFTAGALCLFVFFSGAYAHLGLIAS